MRGFSALFAVAAAIAVFAVGCSSPRPADNCHQHCPNHCQPHCFPQDVFHQPSCPDGYCPSPRHPTGSIEVGDDGESEVNREALQEEKAGPGCPTCVVRPVVRPSAVHRPVSIRPVQQPNVSPLEEVKDGTYHCEACKRATVGEQWKEIWADDGTALTFLCTQCWDRMDANRRMSALESYLDRQKQLKPSQRFYARAAVRELSRR